ncbi:tyrosine-type recombinase/integrase [Pandoraea horticolens]|uniref:tyrosine-type recombinase/integrase n=1 Tax=Pandoraea horticolens TaxID=2508298 RepID=UPI003CCDF53B
MSGHRIRARKVLPQAWSRTQAEKFDKQECARLYATVVGVDKPPATIDQAVAIYIEERVPQLKHGKGAAQELALLLEYYNGKPIDTLADVCRQYTQDERERLAPATIRNRLRYLTSACRYAWRHHDLGDEDPAARVVMPSVRNERQHYVTREQMLRLAKVCSHLEARKAIRIAFYSGMRLGEILRYEIREEAFWLADTKNGLPRLVPIHSRIAACARSLKQATPKITIQRAFERARRDVEMPHLHFHDPRHSAASALVNAGVDLFTVGRILGHRDTRSTQRYAHLAVDSLASAVNKIGQKNPHRKNKNAR